MVTEPENKANLTACYHGLIGDALPGGAIELGAGTFHPLVLLFVLSGSLMISKTLRIPKF
jgi:CDP-diacylglycerol---serine O-phosphatidyltransferase